MPKIKLNDLDYGGSPTVEDADHLMVADTRNQTLSAQNIITNILGDMAQLEHNATASKAYVKGEYLVLGSYFYKATDDIAQGDTLVAGTNIEQTNVGAEMSGFSNKMKYKNESRTTNSYGWIIFPQNIIVVLATFATYNSLILCYEAADGFLTNSYINLSETNPIVKKLSADTSYAVRYWYIES